MAAGAPRGEQRGAPRASGSQPGAIGGGPKGGGGGLMGRLGGEPCLPIVPAHCRPPPLALCPWSPPATGPRSMAPCSHLPRLPALPACPQV